MEAVSFVNELRGVYGLIFFSIWLKLFFFLYHTEGVSTFFLSYIYLKRIRTTGASFCCCRSVAAVVVAG